MFEGVEVRTSNLTISGQRYLKVNPAANHLQCEFLALCSKLDAAAKVIPNDKEKLFQEKEDWCHKWQDVMTKLERCWTDALVHNLMLSLSAKEIAASNEAHAFFEQYSAQISAIKKVAEQQKAEKRKAKDKDKVGTLTDNPIESEKDTTKDDAEDTDAKGGDEEEVQPGAPRWVLSATGIPDLYCMPCRNAKTRKASILARTPSCLKVEPLVEDILCEGRFSFEPPARDPSKFVTAKEATPSIMEEKEKEAVEEEDGEDINEMQFLMRAELKCTEVWFIQMEGMMKEMAISMKFVCGCMNRVDKRKCCD
ncbi:hypothetical protein EDD22DRAFT_852531 [Suillus occidentalis]|nr:hypothetical protein EDD22DRAFT_852531 [Suillus occidentalis]